MKTGRQPIKQWSIWEIAPTAIMGKVITEPSMGIKMVFGMGHLLIMIQLCCKPSH